jgi:hypothetical protein
MKSRSVVFLGACGIFYFGGGENLDYVLLGYDAVQS